MHIISQLGTILKAHSKRISYLYNEVFSWLPLASLVDNKIYVVHGGISDRTLLKDVSKIKREKYVSILKPPILNDNGEIIENLNMSELFEWRQVLDALWLFFIFYFFIIFSSQIRKSSRLFMNYVKLRYV
jgi:hypothetical protein